MNQTKQKINNKTKAIKKMQTGKKATHTKKIRTIQTNEEKSQRKLKREEKRTWQMEYREQNERSMKGENTGQGKDKRSERTEPGVNVRE